MTKKRIVLNPWMTKGGGKAMRTIKAQYYKVSLANFLRQDGLGATAIIEYEEQDN